MKGEVGVAGGLGLGDLDRLAGIKPFPTAIITLASAVESPSQF